MSANTALIICIGNVARGDDGVAHAVAAILGEHPADGARVLAATGLDVAHAAEVASADLLVVVDAVRRATPAVEVSPLAPGTAAHSGHAIDAPGLLAVASALYGAAPEAVLVAVAAPEMGHTEELSAIASAAASEAADTVRSLLEQQAGR
ncbi:MAG: hydrogenase maturation protease [Coriobacteriia bacterium]|nr:hydrogenase maturation protease [Coriobacteriia bacterium]